MQKISLADRIEITETFLSFFPGNSIFVSKFDPHEVNGYNLNEVEAKPWHYHGSLDEYIERLVNSNSVEKGRGVFFCVNDLDKYKDKNKKRTNKMWTRSRAIWCEDDNIREDDPNDFRTDWPIIPNLVVNTSPGKYHYYWLTDTNNQIEWQSVQATMVEKYESDKSAKDLARVLRLPGFYHLKNPEYPHFVNYVKLRDTPYTWDEIKKAFPPSEDFSNTSKDYDSKIEKAKRERIFVRSDPTLGELMEKKMVKGKIEPGIWDITCPWVYEHTNKEDSGTRYFQGHFNGYDQANFKCNHDHCQGRTIKDLREKIGYYQRLKVPESIRQDHEISDIARPKFPKDFMADWPEPWNIIWDSWKKIPRELSQPLLVPTILSLHGFILNSKYITDWGRRPNLYQLNLAESTANKDTNSKDVLRALSEIMTKMGIFNTIFDKDLFSSDSNISSDTAFLQVLEGNNGNFYWLNTEATRVFQQLSSSGNNSSVMALSDKMIEVVDGHGITSKAKASGRINGCDDPNVQIVFFAQPETIEKYITEEMVDSGFLGRAIITLDDKDLMKERRKMFIRRTTHNKTIDERLAKFYASRSIGTIARQVFIAAPDEGGLEDLDYWSETRIRPIMETSSGSESSMYKMISRIGNTAEQLYAIILGICREWDSFIGRPLRQASDISPKCMFSILEFWAKSKAYVINEYVNIESDPMAKTIENVMVRIINGNIKIEERYREIVEERGMVPRSILLRSMRNQGALKRKMNLHDNTLFSHRVNMVLNTLIENDILREDMLATKDRLLKGKRTKYIGFI